MNCQNAPESISLRFMKKVTASWFQRKKGDEGEGDEVAKWPPDLNPIGNLWRELKLMIQKKDPWNLINLKRVYQEEWAKIPTDICKNLISQYPKRLEAVIANKGYNTKY